MRIEPVWNLNKVRAGVVRQDIDGENRTSVEFKQRQFFFFEFSISCENRTSVEFKQGRKNLILDSYKCENRTSVEFKQLSFNSFITVSIL
ncbi:MAG: hypothetical protein ABDI07_12135 [Candidatus Kryptonium sp.]